MAATPVAVGHLLRRHDDDLPARSQSQLGHVVEDVVDVHVRQLRRPDGAGRCIDTAREPAVGLDEERRDPAGRSRRGDACRLVCAEPCERAVPNASTSSATRARR
jgi:hypothetical protein